MRSGQIEIKTERAAKKKQILQNDIIVCCRLQTLDH